nr:hypothetical protein [uncultured Pseudodesulfovibrio sp.]
MARYFCPSATSMDDQAVGVVRETASTLAMGTSKWQPWKCTA